MKKCIVIAIILLSINFCAPSRLVLGESPPSMQIKNRRIYLYGREFFIKGVSYALNYPKTVHYSQIPQELLEKDFAMMKEAGINTIRTYEPMPEIVLDLAEKYNIMLIENVAYPGDWTNFNSQKDIMELKKTAVKNVMRHKDRRCILAWDIWNDAPFTYGYSGQDVIKKYGEEKINQSLKEIYDAVREIDPNHPITGANLIYSEESIRLGAEFLDILSYNTYLGIYDWLNGKFSYKKAEEMAEQLIKVSKKHNKPVIISEVGYSTYFKDEEQGEAIQQQIKAVGNKLAGIIIFEWADEWDKAGNPSELNNHIEEHWGIVDGYRNPKDGYYKLKEIYQKPTHHAQ